MNARDIKTLLDAIDDLFGVRRVRPRADYALHDGDIVSVGEFSYTVRDSDFADPALATAAELAVCLHCEGADVTVVESDERGFKRIEPAPTIRRVGQR